MTTAAPGLTHAQGRVLTAFNAVPAPTYRTVASKLGLHVGTIHSHLRKIRLSHPALYNRFLALRRAQLDQRHALRVGRMQARSERFFARRRHDDERRQLLRRWVRGDSEAMHEYVIHNLSGRCPYCR